MLHSKKQSLMARLSSSESHVSLSSGIFHLLSLDDLAVTIVIILSPKIESPGEGSIPASPALGNVVVNPSWPPHGLQLPSQGAKPKLSSRLSQMSLRSTVSDTELEQVRHSAIAHINCMGFYVTGFLL